MLLSRTAIKLAGGLALFAALTLQGGVQRQPLPRFPLFTGVGLPITSDRLPHKGPWLLVYVEPYCRKCASILQELRKEEAGPHLNDQVVVIVGHTQPRDLRPFKRQYPRIADSQWFADPRGQALKALQLKAVPAVFGVDERDQMEWVLVGALANTNNLDSILKTWRR